MCAKLHTGAFLENPRIVDGLLADAEGLALVDQAVALSDLEGRRAVAINMVAWFSQTITTGTSPWGGLFERQQKGGAYAYRPKAALESPIASDSDIRAIEGEPRLFFHFRRERDSSIAKAKRDHALATLGRVACEACGFSTQSAYPGLAGEVCEVHHRRPLAAAAGAVETTLDDLAILCANCHRAIHRTKPFLSVEEFTSAHLGANKAPY